MHLTRLLTSFSLGRRFMSSLLSTSNEVGKMYTSPLNPTQCADVYLVPMFSDNYGHILVDKSTNQAALIDPAECEPVLKTCSELGLDVKMALITHKHNDHCGGNEGVKRAIPGVRIIGTGYERIPGATESVREGDTIELGNLIISVISVPCHTTGHVAYFVQSKTEADKSPILFPGDTLFVGGCGRFFEGTASDMLKNMDKLSSLPPTTAVYCAHEYTTSNLKFLASVDPTGCEKVLQAVLAKREEGLPTVPSTIGNELSYNLFMKTRDPRVQALVGKSSAEETMATLREMKNKF